MSFAKIQDRLKKLTMEKLIKLDRKITDDPNNKNPDKNSIYIYKSSARKKLDDIGWAIYYKLQEKLNNIKSITK